MKQGDRVGKWEVLEFLGHGGNADVWKARCDEHGTVALKILRERKPDADKFKRFRDEIDGLRALKDVQGVLPVLDASIPERPTRKDPAWLATPIAVPIQTALGDAASLEQVVEAIRCIAETLARLAERDISHRDIKPANLYRYADGWVVGDFGLISFPGKEGLTANGTRVGPAFYIAPEMLNTPDKAHGPAADVYSLGKTLWVLASGQTYPLPGEHIASESTMAIATHVRHTRAAILDQLMERTSRIDPAKRPTADAMAVELAAWLHPHEPKAAADESLDDILPGLRAALSPRIRLDKQREVRIRQAEHLFADVIVLVEEIGLKMERACQLDAEIGEEYDVPDHMKPNHATFGTIPQLWERAYSATIESGTLRKITLRFVVHVDLSMDDTVIVTAQYHIGDEIGDQNIGPGVVAGARISAPIESAELANKFPQPFDAEARTDLKIALQKLAEYMGELRP